MAAAAARPLVPDEESGPGRTTSPPVRRALHRTALRLEYATIAWNVLEVAVAVGTGVGARSMALVAFGLDSTIEVFASLVPLAIHGAWPPCHRSGPGARSEPSRARSCCSAPG